MYRQWTLLAAASLVTFSSGAQAVSPKLELSETAPYRNEASGVEIAPLFGYQRKVTLYGEAGLDVGIDYRSDSANEEITFFLFRRVTGDSALWLDRIAKVVTGQDRLGQVSPAYPAYPFATRPGSGANALGVVYGLSGKQFKSTGAAVIASAGWYVAIRATSAVRSPEEMKSWLASASASIRWPANQQPLPAAAPIQRCTKPLRDSEKARLHIPSLGALLAEAALVHNVEGDENNRIADRATAGPWCLERDISPMSSAYRQLNDRDSYLLAIADSGRGYRVAKSPLAAVLDPGAGQSYFVSWIDIDHVDGFGAFDRLPAPHLLENLADERPYAFRATTWGDGTNITFNSDVVNAK